MRAFLCVFLAACSFSAPPLPGAREACIDWMEAERAKALACGDEPESTNRLFDDAIRDTCGHVVWSDTSEIEHVCIPALMKATCEERLTLKCGAYAHL